ncbi:hypothetical protein O0880_06565 [Janthinobacterium sp. SUN118]|uniref:hypothetical protein n=1 Tax=Janthinobacterium sp. SUN118 TaxID=3004100 RepID=UPI0025AF5C39|nr:hypothetical protein [Janthinobacterium sp. SUN118]MDN2709086.1 hypothetical protein [Janthinobacterium sp. SUN118]
MAIDCYHGTFFTTAEELVAGKVDVTIGGGELGMGFYTGEHLWVAKSWAANRHGLQGAVVHIEVEEDDFFGLEPLLLSRIDALKHRDEIRKANTTRTHTFKGNLVWSPIVGTTRVDADQYKFENSKAQALLNGAKVHRKRI